MIPSLARDLAEWDLASGRSPGGSLVFPNGRDEPWTDAKFRNWRSRAFEPAATRAGLVNVTPYSLRHTRASLLLASGVSLPDAAAELGHGVQVLASTYAHVVAEYRGRPPIDVEAEVHRARQKEQVA
jgi:integrase